MSSHWKQICAKGIILPFNETKKFSEFAEIKPAGSAIAFSPCVLATLGDTLDNRIANLNLKELTTFIQAEIFPLKLGSNLAKPV